MNNPGEKTVRAQEGKTLDALSEQTDPTVGMEWDDSFDDTPQDYSYTLELPERFRKARITKPLYIRSLFFKFEKGEDYLDYMTDQFHIPGYSGVDPFLINNASGQEYAQWRILFVEDIKPLEGYLETVLLINAAGGIMQAAPKPDDLAFSNKIEKDNNPYFSIKSYIANDKEKTGGRKIYVFGSHRFFSSPYDKTPPTLQRSYWEKVSDNTRRNVDEGNALQCWSLEWVDGGAL